mmetsp:Transcript_25107/g.55064  ORF Transcript_25107/g.55064 Transcript_25107/m.55064 type:complete len:216 (+) Transcript_25107:316-963(+)
MVALSSLLMVRALPAFMADPTTVFSCSSWLFFFVVDVVVAVATAAAAAVVGGGVWSMTLIMSVGTSESSSLALGSGCETEDDDTRRLFFLFEGATEIASIFFQEGRLGLESVEEEDFGCLLVSPRAARTRLFRRRRMRFWEDTMDLDLASSRINSDSSFGSSRASGRCCSLQPVISCCFCFSSLSVRAVRVARLALPISLVVALAVVAVVVIVGI